MNKVIQKCEPYLSGSKLEEKTKALIRLCYDCNQLPLSMSKCRRSSAHKRTQTRRSVPLQTK